MSEQVSICRPPIRKNIQGVTAEKCNFLLRCAAEVMVFIQGGYGATSETLYTFAGLLKEEGSQNLGFSFGELPKLEMAVA